MSNNMCFALDLAKKSSDDIPVGALILKDGKIIASACNEKELRKDVTCHAEIIAIKKAQQVLNDWHLKGCDMYVTLEPCPMCAWAIISSRISRVYFGAYDTLYGALGSVVDLRKLSNSKLEVYGGIMEEECKNLLDEYFEKMRRKDVRK